MQFGILGQKIFENMDSLGEGNIFIYFHEGINGNWVQRGLRIYLKSLTNPLWENRKQGFIILGNHCFLDGEVPEMTLGSEFKENMSLGKGKLR